MIRKNVLRFSEKHAQGLPEGSCANNNLRRFSVFKEQSALQAKVPVPSS
jgi:hypothetical protein